MERGVAWVEGGYLWVEGGYLWVEGGYHLPGYQPGQVARDQDQVQGYDDLGKLEN